MKRLTLPVLLIASAEAFSDIYDPQLRQRVTTLIGFSGSEPCTIEQYVRAKGGHPVVSSISQDQESAYLGYDPLF